MLELSTRAHSLKPSPTLAITAKAKRMKDDGADIISFAAGEPDFSTPDDICDAAIASLRSGFTKYTPTNGILSLKEAICEKLRRENSVHVNPDQIVVSCGAKHSLYNTFMTIVEPGDEVILMAPFWPTYAEQILLAGGVPVKVKTTIETDFVPNIGRIRECVTARTKAILLNSPNNPTGAMIGRELMMQIANLAVEKGLWVVTDEIYDRLIYTQPHVSIASLGQEIAAQTIHIAGVSKTYAMTGWRIGFAAAPVEIAKAMSNLQDQVTSNPTSFAQAGAVAALHMPSESVEAMRSEFAARRELMLDRLKEIPGIGVPNPAGAFYVFADFSSRLDGAICDDYHLAEHLLNHAGLATIPGSAFDGHGHLRLTYATSRADIERGLDRLAQALDNLPQ